MACPQQSTWHYRALLVLSLLTSPFICSGTSNGNASGRVQRVDHISWDDTVVGSPYPVFVFFFSSSHLDIPEELQAELQTLARKYEGIADVVTVDCEGEAMLQLCKRSETVPRLPHMRVYAAKRKRSPYTKSWYKDFQPFDGVPQARQMSMALQTQLVDDSIARIRSVNDWEKMNEESSLPKVHSQM
jgi:hypothetical protein